MAASYVQTKTGAQNTALATVTVTFDQAATAGNLLVLIVAGDDYVSSGNKPSGWTESTGCRQETFLGHYLWWRVAAGGETSVSYTEGVATTSTWQFYEISGLEASPYDISAGQFAQSSGTSYTTNSLTPSSGERLILASIGGSNSAGAFSGVDTWLNSFTERGDSFTTLGSGTRDQVGMADRQVTANGSTSYSSGATFSGGTTAQARTAIIIAFKVASGGTPGTITTVVGAATAAGGSSTLTGAGTMSTVAGSATAAGGTSTFTAGGTLTTTAGDAPAAGGTGALAGAVTVTTTAGDATAAGGTGTMTGGAPSTITTVVGDAAAAGGDGAMLAGATFATVAGAASASGGVGSFTAAAVLATIAGGATAAGGVGNLAVLTDQEPGVLVADGRSEATLTAAGQSPTLTAAGSATAVLTASGRP